MKRLTTTLLFLLTFLLVLPSSQAASLDEGDNDAPALFQRAVSSKAPAFLSRDAFKTTGSTSATCDICGSGGQVENISFVYSGPSATITFRISNPQPENIKTVSVENGDVITLDADEIAGRTSIGNGIQIIINGVNNNNPIALYLNGTQVTEKGGTAFHTSCSPGTPKVGDIIGSSATSPTYAFEVIGGGSTSNENSCRVLDLECDATAAPLLDFQNLTDPGQAPESGDALKFTAPFTNNAANANASATNIEVTVTYDDSQFTYVNGSATGGDGQDASVSGEIVFTLNDLTAGATETLMFNLTVNSGATAGRVTASITAATGTDVDSTPDNLGLFASEDDECEVTFQNLPVELVAFDAQADGRSATLAWQTASETNNAGFELQHRYLGEANKASAFSALAFIEGHGTTEAAQNYQFRLDDLEPGRHVFRLKQVDYDGTFEYSPEIEVAIDLPEAYLVSPVYPNPFNPQASFSFSVSRSQEVSVAIYNMLGQRVAMLFEGVVSEGTSRTLQIDGSALQSGTYLVRVQGESFVNTQTITLVK